MWSPLRVIASTRSALQIAAVTGLLMSLLGWWGSQSSRIYVCAPFVGGSLALEVSPPGVFIRHNAGFYGWVYKSNEVPDAEVAIASFNQSYSHHQTSIPGVYAGSLAPGATTFIARHWLVSLTFFVFAALTSVRWENGSEHAGETQDEPSVGQRVVVAIVLAAILSVLGLFLKTMMRG